MAGARIKPSPSRTHWRLAGGIPRAALASPQILEKELQSNFLADRRPAPIRRAGFHPELEILHGSLLFRATVAQAHKGRPVAIAIRLPLSRKHAGRCPLHRLSFRKQ